MAKGTTAKIKELKGIKPEKVNEEELKAIQALVSNINQLTMQVGRAENQKHGFLHQLAGINDEMMLTQDKLKEQYGTNDINITDGTINYQEENGQTNS